MACVRIFEIKKYDVAYYAGAGTQPVTLTGQS